jgi:hypothetical protein
MNPQDLYAAKNGYNAAQNSLTRWTTVRVTGDNKYFPAPQCLGFFDPGPAYIRADALKGFNGYEKTALFWAALTWNQYWYIYNTVLGGAYSAFTTQYIRVGFDAYARCNAVMNLPKQVEVDGKFFAPKRVLCDLVKMIELTP